jgi:hypothetical protein
MSGSFMHERGDFDAFETTLEILRWGGLREGGMKEAP